MHYTNSSVGYTCSLQWSLRVLSRSWSWSIGPLVTKIDLVLWKTPRKNKFERRYLKLKLKIGFNPLQCHSQNKIRFASVFKSRDAYSCLLFSYFVLLQYKVTPSDTTKKWWFFYVNCVFELFHLPFFEFRRTIKKFLHFIYTTSLRYVINR